LTTVAWDNLTTSKKSTSCIFFRFRQPPWRGSERPFKATKGPWQSASPLVLRQVFRSLQICPTAPTFLVTMGPRALIQISIQSIEMLSIHAGENGRLPPYQLSPEVPLDFPPWQSTVVYVEPVPLFLQDIRQCMITIWALRYCTCFAHHDNFW